MSTLCLSGGHCLGDSHIFVRGGDGAGGTPGWVRCMCGRYSYDMLNGEREMAVVPDRPAGNPYVFFALLSLLLIGLVLAGALAG